MGFREDVFNEEKINDIDLKDVLFGCDTEDNIWKMVRYLAVDYGDVDAVLKDERLSPLKKLAWPLERLDCIFSFKTYFNGFLRGYLNGTGVPVSPIGYLYDNYEKFLSPDIRTKRLSDIYKISEEKSVVIWYEINRFAKNTHTIGNYMPCPDSSFNKLKGFSGYRQFQDRIDLFYADVVDKKKGFIQDNGEKKYYQRWFRDNTEKYFLSEMLKVIDYRCPIKREGSYNSCFM